MLNKFLKYNNEHQLFTESDKVLLTVSGGKDSVAMVHLFLKAGFDFGIAHCNFKLRGEDADADEQFVKALAQKNNIPFFNIAFETEKYAQEKRVSIQMAARELRYSWFEKIRSNNNYQYIATAHHKNDVAETMLINLTKGTGLAGLHGIKPKTKHLIRPLLGVTRKDVELFILEHNIIFREDQSNANTKYVRNKIRHKVIPVLEEINPSLVETFYQEAQQFSELEEIVNQKVDEVKKQCIVVQDNLITVSIDALLKLSPLKTYLYYFIKDFGFNKDDVLSIVAGMKEQSGKRYYSLTHQILKDREELIISLHHQKEMKKYMINSIADFDNLPVYIQSDIIKNEKLTIDRGANFAYLDKDKVKFPLTLRKWKEGDVFRPLGMRGKKKVSDFFIDEKVSLLGKENTWLLLSDNKICWIVGMRINDDFKLTHKTKQIILLKLESS